eukprot:5724459-Lingulodinium_polyedra.AAC.1
MGPIRQWRPGAEDPTPVLASHAAQDLWHPHPQGRRRVSHRQGRHRLCVGEVLGQDLQPARPPEGC